ncbi:MAG: bifunctional demethylmenaquinone methyltransferase/2-methoxy-6-polyprenyl-1,4-benzoquinol methylase UbiE, partial [Paramuribaculum sp.]|nr:bifunctional demethylmenaquinone methyltransferase/2-methoxy-6-polyprenyl-1,4-benzoquinol methylase UbiE [Paramuribaculum sp.]
TFGIDRIWRRKAVKMVAQSPHDTILDIATGTGDLAILLAQKTYAKKIIGLDLSSGMLEVGRQKVTKYGLSESITFTEGDSLNLPFPENSFDAITVAYGVRNFEDLHKGYKEMLRVLRPGGKVTVIELSTPDRQPVKTLYRFYTRTLVPFVGRLISHDTRAYSYLPESIAAVPQSDKMTRIMQEAGFADTTFRRLTFGTCTIYQGKKTI